MVANYEPMRRQSHTADGDLASPEGLTRIRVNKMMKLFDDEMRKDSGLAEDAFVRMEAFCAGVIAHMVRNTGMEPQAMLGLISSTSSLLCENMGRLTTNMLVHDGTIPAHEVMRFVKGNDSAQRSH